ncbi:hypothetical protein [Succinimonas sp.]|jgi:hypothetical protein
MMMKGNEANKANEECAKNEEKMKIAKAGKRFFCHDPGAPEA